MEDLEYKGLRFLTTRQDDNVLEDTAVLNYMLIVLDVFRSLNSLDYPEGWREPEYNLFVKSYNIISDLKHITIVWKNMQEETHTLSFTRFKFKATWLNTLYFKNIPRVSTSDVNRRHNVLAVVYADFCKETGAIKGNFATVDSFKHSLDFTMSLVYVKFFFKFMTLVEFLNIYDPKGTAISRQSTVAMSRYVDYLLNQTS